MRRLVIMTVILVFTLSISQIAEASWWCNNRYQVKGQIKVLNEAYNQNPYYEGVAGIKVRIYNGIFHTQTTTTRSDGSFIKTWYSCSKKLNLNISFVPTSSAVNVSQLMFSNYYKIRPSKTFSKARPGSHDFGTFLYGKKDTKNVNILKVFQMVKEILAWLDEDHGINFLRDRDVGSGRIEVGYPSLTPNDSSWYTPTTRQINLKGQDFQPSNQKSDVLAHEFGHLFQNGFGKWYLNIPGYNGDMGWSYTTPEPPGTANLEGFGVFFEYLFMSEHGFDTYASNIEYYITQPNLKDNGATNHAAFFYDLYDSNQDSDDSCHVDRCEIPLEQIMNVFSAHSYFGLKAFSIAKNDMDDFIDRYYQIYGDPPGECDLDELAYLNHLKENPQGDFCDDSPNELGKKTPLNRRLIRL